jgi:polysaccharide pyruvyl transferase WcaK-like protein
LMVGMRLHALIFAAISSTPMIGLSYDPKIDAFLQQVDQPLIGDVDGNWTSDELIDLMKHQLERSEEEQEKLSTIVGEMRTKANETAKDVIQLLR